MASKSHLASRLSRIFCLRTPFIKSNQVSTTARSICCTQRPRWSSIVSAAGSSSTFSRPSTYSTSGAAEGDSTRATAGLEVPTLDLSTLTDHDSAARQAMARQIAQACSEWGFFKVVGHGVSVAHRAAVFDAARGFFAMPRAAKQAVKRNRNNSRGWFDDELTKQKVDWKEGFDFGFKPVPGLPDADPANHCLDGFNQWPEGLPEFRAEMQRYFATMEALAAPLTGLIAEALGLPSAYFAPAFDDHSSFLRLNYYPPCSDPGQLGISPHKDAGFLTIILSDDIPSLQVLYRDQWVTVQPNPEAFIINIGDMCQVWSNDRFQAPLHRVLTHPHQPRLSMPFFYNPAYAVEVTPVPGSGPPHYRPLHWGEFRERRYAGDYADYGAEVQITDYRLTPASYS